MKALYLDLASHAGLIALSDGEAVLAQEACDHKVGDNELLPLIEKVLQKSKCSYPDLTHIACVVGPGGFTSLRVAVTCANVLCDQLNICAAGIHLSEIYKERSEDSSFLWLHSTKKEELFARTFGDATWTEPTHLSLTDFLKNVPRQLLWAGELIPEHQAVAKEARLEAMTSFKKEWLPSFLQRLSYENQPLVPWYGRSF